MLYKKGRLLKTAPRFVPKFAPKAAPKTAPKAVPKAELIPIGKIAKKLGIDEKFLECYGPYKAKVSLDLLKKVKARGSKYIFVTSITPTPLGEGKTVTTIGLSMALNRIGAKAVACLRQPALGPIFGIKGGATGGGRAQVVPMEDINLHFTGDNHAVTAAHNLGAAVIDNSLFRNNPLDIDMTNILWRRVLDVNDRALRNITIGMGAKSDGVNRRTGFDISAASELMAILALSSSIEEVRQRVGKIIVAYTKKQTPVTFEQLKIAGAIAVLLKDALKPNLVQTSEGTPCFIHTGPFGNIAHGSSSIIADKLALGLSDYVVTEGGFGADIGAEKFFNIKCRVSGLKPDVCVLVCSVRAFKVHSGDFEFKDGKPLDNLIFRENVSSVERGASNLDKQIENIKLHGVPCLVCINRFDSDSEKELDAVRRCAMASGAAGCVTSEVWQKGGEGGEALARAVIDITQKIKPQFRFLYPVDLPIKEKIGRIAKSMYGAKEVMYSEESEEQIRLIRKLKLDNLPVCMAKTQFSLSHDPKRKGRPRNFKLPVTSVHVSHGAGFLYVICGDINTMPGLPKLINGARIDFDRNGNIAGLV
ncbi:MAG: formate--tetrahydrofolate ligase [Candidatus Omnitrophica bacterium]|nr:formate--tetrahydrofolate ligase [Candidatus Omnitrophota bacterium]